MDLSNLVNITTILANVATFLGIPLAIIVLVVDRRRAREDREQHTYQALQSEYSDFLKLCLEHSELQLHDYHPERTVTLTPEQHDRRMVALEILVSMFESAYFLYHHGHHSEFKKRQWTGWEEFMRDWAVRGDFQEAWNEHLGSEFDSEFILYMNQLIQAHG
ncbi:MAG: hypothetical protein KKH17_09715 [Proteobacteria bacterium]|nr:hypothetical protein [Desulfobacteraceae bacterium]MBU4068554.1 hypothetical protein [Pseudomonadota bacterium]